MLYILQGRSNVLGISLGVLGYMGISKERLMRRISSMDARIYDDSSREVSQLCRKFGKHRYAIVYFLSNA